MLHLKALALKTQGKRHWAQVTRHRQGQVQCTGQSQRQGANTHTHTATVLPPGGQKHGLHTHTHCQGARVATATDKPARPLSQACHRATGATRTHTLPRGTGHGHGVTGATTHAGATPHGRAHCHRATGARPHTLTVNRPQRLHSCTYCHESQAT